MIGTRSPGINFAIRVARVTPSVISRRPSESSCTRIGGIPFRLDPNCRIWRCSFQGSAPFARLGGRRSSQGSTSRIDILIKFSLPHPSEDDNLIKKAARQRRQSMISTYQMFDASLYDPISRSIAARMSEIVSNPASKAFRSSSRIHPVTFFSAEMTVEWLRPPKKRPISL